MQLLARAAQTLAAADEPEAAIDRALEAVARDLGPIATIERGEGTLTVTWRDGVHGEDRDTFAEALAGIANLAHRAQGSANDHVLDAAGFHSAVDRVSAGARWRGARMAVTVFQVDGMVLGPGVDESSLIEMVGQAARRCVRSDDVVGHLGAAQFALLFPRAGTFEARSAYRRVRDAVMRIEWDQGLVCSAAGFAELEPGQTGAELLADARARLNAALTKNAYSSPGGGSPITPLAG
jgi:hypothetical protein